MNNYTFTSSRYTTTAFAKVYRAVKPVYSALAGKKQFRLMMAALLLLVLSSMGNNVFAITTTYYYPSSITVGGGGSYCVGAAATGLTGSIATSSTTSGGSSASVTWAWYYNTTGATGTLTGATMALSGASYSAAAAPHNAPLPSVDISTATPGVYYYFLYVSYSGGGTGAGSLYSSLVTVTVNSYPTPILGTPAICSGLTVTVSDGTAGGTWSSGSPGIATISPAGVITGVAGGTSLISYTNGAGCSATIVATISSGVSAILGASTICLGSSATVSDAAGGGTWSSTNPGVATITTGGTINTVSQGTAIINYTTASGCNASRVETVNATPGTIAGTPIGCPGFTASLSDPSTGGTWSSSVPGVATIGATSGVLNSIMTGTTVVTYDNGCGAPATVVVTVNPLPAAITGPGDVCPSGGTITLSDVTTGGTWSSSPTTTATAVTTGPTTGRVTGINPGTAVITYTSPLTCITTTVVTVDPLPSPITGNQYQCVGATTTLSDAVAGGTWTSGTIPVASVDSSTGVVTGLSPGSTIITYTTGCGYVTAEDSSLASPSAIVGRDSVCIGGTTTFASIPGSGTWSSSTPGIASILPGSGIISGLAVGKAAITYTIPPGCFVTDSVTVVALPPAITGIMHACPGTSVTLHDAITGGTWSSAQTYIATVNSSTGKVTGVAADTANIIYTDPTGCVVSTTITINPLPAPIVGGITTCATSIDTLYDATPGGVWSSATPGIANVSSTGIVMTTAGGTATISYTLPATGCAVSKSFLVRPLPVPIVTYDFAINSFVTDTFYVSYQWYNTLQNTIPAAISYKTAALYDGYYWVTVTDTNGCTATSVQSYYTTSWLGTTNNAKAAVRIYPNPANSIVYIESTVAVRAVISGIDGKTAMEEADAKQLNISGLANGVYFISLYTGNGERLMVQKLIKE